MIKRYIGRSKAVKECIGCQDEFITYVSDKKKYCTIPCANKFVGFQKGHKGYKYWLGKKLSKQTIDKLSLAHKGKKQSTETRLKRAEALRGEKAPNWQGGKSRESTIIRGSLEYRLWREAVFKRDDYTCQICNKRGNGELNADHILSFAYYPELRFELPNGRTLCIDCHKQTEGYLKHFSKKDINEWVAKRSKYRNG